MKLSFRAALTLSAALALTLSLAGSGASGVTPRLSHELLSVSQMPKGWSVENPSGSVQAGCLTNVVGLSKFLIAKGIVQTSSSRTFMEDDQSVPMVSEMLATYTYPLAAYQEILSTIVHCKRITGQIFGVAVRGTLKETNSAHFSNSSATFAAKTSIMGSSFDEDLVIVRKGSVIMALVEGNLPPLNIHQFEGFVTRALTKVP